MMRIIGGVRSRDAQIRHPYHVQFVDVAGDDAKEAESLEQRRTRVLGQCQHAMLESEQAQFGTEKCRRCIGNREHRQGKGSE